MYECISSSYETAIFYIDKFVELSIELIKPIFGDAFKSLLTFNAFTRKRWSECFHSRSK